MQVTKSKWPILKSSTFPFRTNTETSFLKKNKSVPIFKLPTQTQRKKWTTFTYFSSLIHKVTNLFKSTDLNIAFRAYNTIYNQSCDRIPLNKPNCSGIYKLQCRTCNKSYIGQTGYSTEIPHQEHTRYIKTNNPISVYALHILNNGYEYGNAEQTMKLLKKHAVRKRN